jgi:hypothetical protein
MVKLSWLLLVLLLLITVVICVVTWLRAIVEGVISWSELLSGEAIGAALVVWISRNLVDKAEIL